MAGHSKWANIKHRKMAQDAKRGQTYAKVCREIMMAAKIAGPDPAGNFRLRTAIERAKAAGIPNDTVDRAIQKGSGQLAGDNMENLSYEGYGPGGVAVYIETVTDNRNRTAGDIRSYFNKYNGNLGESGCVSWMFIEKGQIQIPMNAVDEDRLLETALDAGAEDVHTLEEQDIYEVWTTGENLNTVCQALADRQIRIEAAEVTRISLNTVQVTDPTIAKPLLKLLDTLESHDDVQNVYANFEMDEALLESCALA